MYIQSLFQKINCISCFHFIICFTFYFANWCTGAKMVYNEWNKAQWPGVIMWSTLERPAGVKGAIIITILSFFEGRNLKLKCIFSEMYDSLPLLISKMKYFYFHFFLFFFVPLFSFPLPPPISPNPFPPFQSCDRDDPMARPPSGAETSQGAGRLWRRRWALSSW